MKYYAHSLEGKGPDEWQPLEEHLRNVAGKAADFAKPFKSEDWAWNAGWLHDFGKATNAFQHYLKKCNELEDPGYDADGSVSNHASAGGAWAMENDGPCIGKILAYLAAGHHAGLPDWHAANTGNAALTVRLEEGQRNLEFIREYANQNRQRLKALKKPPDRVRKPEDFHLWVRMLFSCLVDADYLDTERFMRGGGEIDRGRFPPLSELSQKFFDSLNRLETDAPRTEVNRIRAEVRIMCEEKARLPPGFFSLTVPTGGGKTLSAMAFAFRHAMAHADFGFRRILYVIPYTSIIEQTAATLARIFGRENVVEHHSSLTHEKETPRSRMASENWDAPIIVTTNVQFFESLFAAKPGRCRKLHNIASSIVILDEAQMLPPAWLNPCVHALNQLVAHYGVSIMLATATQPALPGMEGKITEVMPDDMKLYDRLKRTDYRLPVDLNERKAWEEIAQELMQHEQVLCVVNTRKDCHDLFKLMPEGTVHLSALMCGRHRSAIIRLIKRKLKYELPLRVISTQLVEAGVDIDFPVVYRALAGMDSIAQAAGRCNREGRLNKENRRGQVHVFIPPKSAPRGLLLKGEQTAREMLAMPSLDLHDAAVFRQYFAQFYASVNDTGKTWLTDRLIKDAVPDLAFQFRTAANDFRLIDDRAQRPVFVRYGRSAKWLNQLRAIGPKRENLRALQRYAVNLSKYDFDRAKSEGLLEDLWQEEFWCWAPTYDRTLGVDIFGSGWTPEDLIH